MKWSVFILRVDSGQNASHSQSFPVLEASSHNILALHMYQKRNSTLQSVNLVRKRPCHSVNSADTERYSAIGHCLYILFCAIVKYVLRSVLYIQTHRGVMVSSFFWNSVIIIRNSVFFASQDDDHLRTAYDDLNCPPFRCYAASGGSYVTYPSSIRPPMDYARRAYPPAYDAARQPGGAANSPATSSAPLRYEDGIRVSINPKYQISSRPEAETPLELPDPPRSEFEFDFGVERRVLAKLMSAGDGVDGFPKVEEDPRVTKFVEMGYDKPAVLMAIMVHGDSHDKPTVEAFEEVLLRCGAIRPYDPSVPSPIRGAMRQYDRGEGFEGVGQEGPFQWVILKDGKYFKHRRVQADILFASAGKCMVWLSEYVHEWGSAGVDEFEKAVREVMFALGQEYKFECVTEANRFCD
eukprot:jgi/Mesvir1/7955/Mv24169-RA.1